MKKSRTNAFENQHNTHSVSYCVFSKKNEEKTNIQKQNAFTWIMKGHLYSIS